MWNSGLTFWLKAISNSARRQRLGKRIYNTKLRPEWAVYNFHFVFI